MALFQKQSIILHSGQPSDFKIECDDLSYSDVECLCYLISKRFKFFSVFGVPSGGEKFANCLKQYCTTNPEDPTLVIDDVLTTGRSMIDFIMANNIPLDKTIGVVIFARGKCPEWVTPVFQLTI